MPLYEYRCEDCGVRFERRQKFSDEPVTLCPECGGSVHRVIGPTGVIFKGSGFYVTDNRQGRGRRSDISTAPKDHKDNKDNKDSKDSSAEKPAENAKAGSDDKNSSAKH
ncbi:MAG: zinc ribbon domain-containing protein [Anaerolineae bacterium]|nr:zinc ribbon domain-containing protein [Anaerolineae bacterium]